MSGNVKIWTSDCLSNPAPYRRPITAEHVLEPSQASEMMRRLAKCQPVGSKELPGDFFFSHAFGIPIRSEHLPDFFAAAAWRIVSERFRDFLQQFEIGDTRFHAARVLGLDRRAQLPGNWYVLNIVSPKNCVVPEQSTPRTLSSIDDFWIAQIPLGNDDVAMNPVDDDVDLWSDPKVMNLPFFSDRLKRAIEGSGFEQMPRFYRCRIV